MISISYTYDRSDFRQAMLMSLQTHPIVLAMGMGLFVIVPWGSAVFMLVMQAQGASIPFYYPLLLLASPPVAVLGWEHSMFRMVQKSLPATGERTYVFSDADVRMIQSGSEHRLEWTNFTRCHSSKHGLFILAGRMPLVQLPERSLTSSSRTDLRALMAAKGLKLSGSWNVGGG